MTTVFSYTARNRNGEFICGSVESESRRIAIRELLVRRLVVTSINEGALPSFSGISSYVRRSERARIEAIRMLSILLSCGISASEALQTCATQSNNSDLRESLHAIIADLESGFSFSSALAKRPREFDCIALAMIGAGEKSGTLVATLSRYAELLERKRRLRARVLSALSYPTVLFLSMISVVLVLSIGVVPAFSAMFVQMHVPVPSSIRAFELLGNILRNKIAIGMILFGLPPLAIVVHRVSRSRRFLAQCDVALRSAPIIGKIVRLIEAERVSRMLGSMLQSGVPIRDACASVVGATSSVTVSQALTSICLELDDGSSFTDAVIKSAAFDGLFMSAVRIGERTGKIDDLLLQIAEQYDFELGISLDRISALIEPAMIILLGSFIGFIVISLIVPLYSMIGNIR